VRACGSAAGGGGVVVAGVWCPTLRPSTGQAARFSRRLAAAAGRAGKWSDHLRAGSRPLRAPPAGTVGYDTFGRPPGDSDRHRTAPTS